MSISGIEMSEQKELAGETGAGVKEVEDDTNDCSE
jgi:hypothetical protein